MSTAPPIAPWIRNVIMLLVCGAWTIFVAVTLIRGQIPSAIVWTVPGATYAALATTSGGGHRRIKVTYDDGGEPEDKKP